MIRLLALVFTLLSWPALAQNIYPALHDVTGVVADDVLNIRTAPSAGSQIIGAFAPFETGIEVIGLSEDGRWGRVNAGERAGWTAMRFLARQPGQTSADWATAPDRIAPRVFECFGTEPFWTLVLFPGGTLDYAALGHGDGTAHPGGYEALVTSASSGKRAFSGWLETEPMSFTGIVGTEICSDGMSDQLYGFSIDLLVSGSSGTQLDAGCCRLAP
jgi:uncharacterized membrane protein